LITYAQLNEKGVVVTVSTLKAPVEQTSLIEIPFGSNPEDYLNKVYDSEEQAFKDSEADVVSIRKITIGAFRRRLTLGEKVAIEASGDPVVRALDKDLMSSSFVDLDLPALTQGLHYLVSAGIIKEDRIVDLLKDGTPDEV
jgi:hypothetical protein